MIKHKGYNNNSGLNSICGLTQYKKQIKEDEVITAEFENKQNTEQILEDMNDDYKINNSNDNQLTIKDENETISSMDTMFDIVEMDDMDANALHPTKSRAKDMEEMEDVNQIYKPNVSIEAQKMNKLYNRKLPKKYNKKN